MDYRATARQILERLGGPENIVSAAHCATRLRLVIAQDSACDVPGIEAVDGVKGVFQAQGQLQIIIGTGAVNKVYEELIAQAGISDGTKSDVKAAAMAKQSLWKRGIKTLGDIFVPIIPAIVASGLLMGLLEGLGKALPALADSGFFQVLSLFANAAFVFLPILIAVSAARTFGGNIFLGAVIGMIMIHPNLINAWSVAGMEAAGEPLPMVSAWFGLYQVPLVGYQGHVIPVVIAVLFMSLLEKKLHQIVPEMIDLFVTPLLTVLITGYLTLTVIGPIFSYLETWVLEGAKFLITIPYGIGSALVGALYAPTVVGGVHHMYNALEAGMLAQNGQNAWMPIATAANVAQGAAALAVALRSRRAKTRSVALPASLSAFLGITEPAIFGVNIRYGRPFIAGCIGGAAGGLVAGLTHAYASAYGITGLFGVLITTHNLGAYLAIMAIAFAVAFFLSYSTFRDPDGAPSDAAASAEVAAPSAETEAPRADKASEASPTTAKESKKPSVFRLYSPFRGKAVPLSDLPDATFASGVLGKGLGFVQHDGKLYAPCDATVAMVYDTKHAIGLSGPAQSEILLHMGINTVELGGKGFTVHCKAGDSVHRGDLLAEMDLALIEQAGYATDTPLLLTNSDDYEQIDVLKTGEVQVGDSLLRVVVRER